MPKTKTVIRYEDTEMRSIDLTFTGESGTLRCMLVKNYKDLRVWQEAYGLVLAVYRLSTNFPRAEQFGITSQLRRAAASVGANIVEGFSRSGQKEFRNFLSIARASAKETEYFLTLAGDLGYADKSTTGSLISRYEGLAAGIFQLISRINSQ